MYSSAEDAAELQRRKWRRRRDAVLLLLLLLVLVSTQARHLTRVGRSGLIAGTSTTVGSAPGAPEPEGEEPDDGSEGAEEEVPELPDAPTPDGIAIAPAAATPAAGDGRKAPALSDPLATTRRRQRQRLAGRPGGPVGPPDAPENNTDDPPVDTGLERSASAKPAPR